MEKGNEKDKRSESVAEQESMLRWGKRKRLRRVKLHQQQVSKSTTANVKAKETRASPIRRCHNGEKANNTQQTDNSRSSSNAEKEGNKAIAVSKGEETFIWPKLMICLSNEEKEKDFMDVKGTKLPQRPKKRSKFVQKSLLLVSPGSWLSELTQDRYDVQEKKVSKKRPKGLKAMRNLKSDSE